MNTPTLITDDTCAGRLRDGDETAFRYVMDRYFPIITMFALRIVHNRSAAEDIAEDTFIKLWQTREKSQTFQSIKAFLFITAKNACLNALRSERSMARRNTGFVAASAEEEETIDREIIRSEVWAEIHRAAAELPEKTGRVFRLAYVEGLPNREIARQLNISVNTVKTQKARAIELLREKLQGKDILPAILTLLGLLEKLNS
ncbi:MAG TPA: RNA polymerase sigma-70 factor [Puia sp.]|uniref:RNA polymerase sigma factor n=1 Tax=Puia sp. TaxID=2045100 RepID=UPI002C1B0DA0|nr:RNA polymerase sigma-70 factor [Puia sp.]HVU94328.1 RNA polymerase sigma-70 factor [Puia sp.]